MARGGGGSLWLFSALAIGLAVLTILLLPLSWGTRAFLLAVGLFCAVFIAVDAGGRGKTFVALTVCALTLYLILTLQWGLILLDSAGLPGFILGVALIVLPLLAGWAIVREIIFGARTQKLGRYLADLGELPQDDLPRSPSGRIDRQAADWAFTAYAQAVEAEGDNWKNWFRLSLAYDAAGDRKRARKAMRIAIALAAGRKMSNPTI